MLGHRLRRWPKIIPTLGERLMFAGISITRWYVQERSQRAGTRAPVAYQMFIYSGILETVNYRWDNVGYSDTLLECEQKTIEE